MKFNFADFIELKIDWKAVTSIAVVILGYALITTL